jgi:hypothetical protein
VGGDAVMQVPHVRFRIAWLMIVVAVAALTLTLFAQPAPESQGPRLFSGLILVTILLIRSCPFLIDRYMGLMTFLVLLAAATVSSWFVDSWRDEWYMGVILFAALIIPLPLSWWTVRWVNSGLQGRSRDEHKLGADRPFPSPLMTLFLAVWYGFAVIIFSGILILRFGIGP